MFSGMSDPQCPVLHTSSKSAVGDICGGKREGKEMEERNEEERKREEGGRRKKGERIGGKKEEKLEMCF